MWSLSLKILGTGLSLKSIILQFFILLLVRSLKSFYINRLASQLGKSFLISNIILDFLIQLLIF